jgi:hypothetical protein
MNASSKTPHCFEFSFPKLDTLVRVEERAELIVIRATRDTFSPERKERFIHELAAEGFIDDEFQWLAPGQSSANRRLRWLVDYEWLRDETAFAAKTRGFMFRLLAGSALLWALLMAAAFLHLIG